MYMGRFVKNEGLSVDLKIDQNTVYSKCTQIACEAENSTIRKT